MKLGTRKDRMSLSEMHQKAFTIFENDIGINNFRNERLRIEENFEMKPFEKPCKEL